MKRELLLFFAICALAIAMVPRERHGVNPGVQEKSNVEFCNKNTPCGWEMYLTNTKIKMPILTNSYCICAVGTECVNDEDDLASNAFIYRCKAPEYKKNHS